jgi:hypothetical protein
MSQQPGNTEYPAWRERIATANDPAFWPIEALDEGLKSGALQWWCDGGAGLVTQVLFYPGGAVVLDAIAGAGDADALIGRMEPQIALWGREHGVSHLRVAGRLGWLRKRPEGWQAHQVVIMKDLTNGHEARPQ